nr:AT hook domain containing protein [Haemonchus contortus]
MNSALFTTGATTPEMRFRRGKKLLLTGRIMDSEENAAADSTETGATAKDGAGSTGRKRGRPPKAKPIQRPEESAPVVDGSSDTQVAPKKRGRKSLAELAKEAASDSTSPPISPSSEKRGRPSTWAYAEYSDGSDSGDDDDNEKQQKKLKAKPTSTTGSGKKRGRPPKPKPADAESAPEVKKVSTGKRGRPPKKRPTETSAEESSDQGALNNGTLKKSDSASEKSDSCDAPKSPKSALSKGASDGGHVLTEKRQRGRPRKADKVDSRKWNDANSPPTGRYTVPLPVPDSWPLVCNRDEIMKELSEMYTNVKDEKLGEFHNQIKAFVFALHWEDGSFSTS